MTLIVCGGQAIFSLAQRSSYHMICAAEMGASIRIKNETDQTLRSDSRESNTTKNFDSVPTFFVVFRLPSFGAIDSTFPIKQALHQASCEEWERFHVPCC